MQSILRICFPYLGDTIGGSHISSLTLYDELTKLGHDPFIVTHGYPRLASYLETRGYNHQVVPIRDIACLARPRLKRPWQLVENTARLVRGIQETRPDVIYTNDSRTHLDWVLAARLTGVPIVFHVRALWGQSVYKNTLCRFTNRFVSISDYITQNCPGFVQQKCSTIRNPVKLTENFDQTKRKEIVETFKLGQDLRIVGFVGNLHDQKCPAIFVEAAAMIAQKFAGDVVFVMIGDDREGLWSSLKRRAFELGLTDRLRYFGFQSDIIAWINALDVLLATGINEGMGRTVVEAMLAGVPVVATRSGGHSELIRDHELGIFCEPGNPEDMASKVLKLLSHPELCQTLAQNGKVWASKECDAQRHGTKMIELFNSVVNCTRRG